MTHRYYVPDLPPAGGSVLLPTTEAHHARTVMRVRSGDAIELFDGRGGVADACIETIDKRQVSCQAEPSRDDSRLPRRNVILAVGVPKGDRAKFLIEKLTELGVARCVPLQCQRSQWTPSAGALEKLRRAMLEACKQSGRNQLLHIDPPTPAGDWWTQDAEQAAIRLLAHPPLAPAAQPGDDVQQVWSEKLADTQKHDNGDPLDEPERPIRIAVGPEGGFTAEEVTAARAAGWQTVGLGRLVYRIETAALAMATLAIHR